MKINKVICDICNKELETEEEIRLDVMKKEMANGYSMGFKKQAKIDLCQDCFNKIFKNIEMEKKDETF